MEISAYSSITANANSNWVYNNTFYDIPKRIESTGTNTWVTVGIGGQGTWTVINNKFYNNIVDRVGQQLTTEWSSGLRGVYLYYKMSGAVGSP